MKKMHIPFLQPKEDFPKLFNPEYPLRRFGGFIFLSPHLDDAVLSCGALLWKLKNLKKNITILTVFTEGGSRPYSPQAKKFLKECGYINALKLFEDRKKEDKDIARFYNGRFIHLGFVDAAWRRNKEDDHIYKNEKIQFSGKISKEDRSLINEISRKVSLNLLENKDIALFAPLGIGLHADHIIVKEVAKNLKQPVLFWEDFPYNRDLHNTRKFFSINKNYKHLFSIKNEGNNNIKYKAIRLYKSQMKGLFPDGVIPYVPENYRVLRDFKI